LERRKKQPAWDGVISVGPRFWSAEATCRWKYRAALFWGRYAGPGMDPVHNAGRPGGAIVPYDNVKMLRALRRGSPVPENRLRTEHLFGLVT